MESEYSIRKKEKSNSNPLPLPLLFQSFLNSVLHSIPLSIQEFCVFLLLENHQQKIMRSREENSVRI